MTNRQINNRMNKIADLEESIKLLKKQIEELENEVKAEFEKNDLDEIETDKYVIRFKEVESRKFDTKQFSKENPDLYEMYRKVGVTKRFTYKLA